MTATVRQSLGRSTTLAIAAITNAESNPAVPIQYAGGDLVGPKSLRELRVTLTAGGASTITVRVYSDLAQTILLLEDAFVFAANGDWDSWQPASPVLLADEDTCYVTAEASVAGAFTVGVTLDFANETRA